MSRLQARFWLGALIGVTVSIVGVSCAQSASAESITVGTGEELQQAVRRAQPGTTIRIAPGDYAGGLQFDDLHGTAEKPIILTAADRQNPPVFKGGSSCLQFSDPAFVELHHLVITGARANGLNIDDGGSLATPARGVVLRGLVVRDIGPDGNRDGIKLSGVDDFRVEDCTIERWGSGGSGIDMVGCHRGHVAGCTFRHQGDLAANGVQTKGGSREIVIQRCRFESAGGRAVNVGGSTGLPYFRPKPEGYEAKEIVVEDCTFIGSMAAICFVGVDGAIVRYNTIFRPKRWILRILQETTLESFVPSRGGQFTNNLVVYRSDEVAVAVNIGPGTAPETFRFANNHWYCLDRPAQSNRILLPTPETNGRHGVDPQFVNAEQGDLRLREASPVRDAGVRPPPAAR